jgi:hypothetical protein
MEFTVSLPNAVPKLHEWLEKQFFSLLRDSHTSVYDLSLQHIHLVILVWVQLLLILEVERLELKSNDNVSILYLVVLDGVLDDVEKDELIKLPIRDYLFFGHVLFHQVQVNATLVDKMLKRPHHIPDASDHVRNGVRVQVQLVLLDFNQLDQIRVVIPHGPCRLFDADGLLNQRLGLSIPEHLGQHVLVKALDHGCSIYMRHIELFREQLYHASLDLG